MGRPVADSIFQILSHFFAEYGYWVVFFGVMLENAGLPVPGETVLIFSGFLAYQGDVRLGRAILTAIAGATVGDSLGYCLGRFGARRFTSGGCAASAYSPANLIALRPFS